MTPATHLEIALGYLDQADDSNVDGNRCIADCIARARTELRLVAEGLEPADATEDELDADRRFGDHLAESGRNETEEHDHV